MLSTRIGVIDAWRGLSFCCVLIGHLAVSRFQPFLLDGTFASLRGGAPDVVPVVKALVWRLAENAAVFGLSVFFVISGYLITSILGAEFARNGAISLRAFYVRRLFRIVPALAAMIAGTVVLWSAGQLETDAAAVLHAATFTCDLTNDCGWVFGHLWSVSLEEQFYLVWPFLFILARGRRHRVTRWFLAASLAVLGFHGHSALHDVAEGLACIALGSLYVVDPAMTRWTERICSGWTTLLAIGFYVSLAFVPAPWRTTGLLAVGAPFAVYLVLIESLRAESVVRRLVDRAPLRAIGLVSYSLYLWQQMFTDAFPSGRDSVLRWLVLLAPVAWLSYRYVEQPAIAFGRRIAKRERTPRMPSAPSV